MKYDSAGLASALKELRAQRGLSQRDVAEKIGISQGKYFRVENDEAKLEDKEINAISRLLKVPIRILLNYSDYKQKFSFAHLKEETLELILDPEKADYLEEALINMKIRELEKKRANLHIKREQKEKEREINDNLGYAIIVRHITKLFDEEQGVTDLGTIKKAIDLLTEVKEEIEENFMDRLDVAKDGLTKLLNDASSSDEPINNEELFIDVKNCLEDLIIYGDICGWKL